MIFLVPSPAETRFEFRVPIQDRLLDSLRRCCGPCPTGGGFGMRKIPGDSQIRAKLDTIEPALFHPMSATESYLQKVPPYPEPEDAQLRAELTAQGIPLFGVDIPRLKAFEKASATGVAVNHVDDPRTGKEISGHGRAEQVRRCLCASQTPDAPTVVRWTCNPEAAGAVAD